MLYDYNTPKKEALTIWARNTCVVSTLWSCAVWLLSSLKMEAAGSSRMLETYSTTPQTIVIS